MWKRWFSGEFMFHFTMKIFNCICIGSRLVASEIIDGSLIKFRSVALISIAENSTCAFRSLNKIVANSNAIEIQRFLQKFCGNVVPIYSFMFCIHLPWAIWRLIEKCTRHRFCLDFRLLWIFFQDFSFFFGFSFLFQPD